MLVQASEQEHKHFQYLLYTHNFSLLTHKVHLSCPSVLQDSNRIHFQVGQAHTDYHISVQLPLCSFTQNLLITVYIYFITKSLIYFFNMFTITSTIISIPTQINFHTFINNIYNYVFHKIFHHYL